LVCTATAFIVFFGTRTFLRQRKSKTLKTKALELEKKKENLEKEFFTDQSIGQKDFEEMSAALDEEIEATEKKPIKQGGKK
jgi:hypothetical protein